MISAMQSPFLIARFVLFALLFNLNILILLFAAWYENATIAAGVSVSATTILFILNSCSTFLFIMLGLVDLVFRQANISHVLFECCWSAVLSVFQTGAAISIAINGPMTCQNSSNDWSVCASSSALIPISWLSTLVASTYFFAVFFATMAHSRVQTDIWRKTVYSVEWFHEPTVPAFCSKSDQSCESGIVLVPSRPTEDVEPSQKATDDDKKAPWARSSTIRRGVDTPFTRQDAPPTVRSSTSTVIVSLPIVPRHAQGSETAGSRFIEKFRESQLTSRSTTPVQCGLQPITRKDPFPSEIDNHDMPISLPRLSEWIRADAVKGLSVHTIPQSP